MKNILSIGFIILNGSSLRNENGYTCIFNYLGKALVLKVHIFISYHQKECSVSSIGHLKLI